MSVIVSGERETVRHGLQIVVRNSDDDDIFLEFIPVKIGRFVPILVSIINRQKVDVFEEGDFFEKIFLGDEEDEQADSQADPQFFEERKPLFLEVVRSHIRRQKLKR